MRFVVLIAIAFFTVVACTPKKLEETALNPAEQTLIRGAVNDISRSDEGSLSTKLPPELAPKLSGVLGKMQAQLPPRPLKLSFINATWTLGGNTRSVNAVYEVTGSPGWAMVQAATATSGGRTILTSIYIQRVPEDPQKLNGFNLADAGLAHWAMLTAMLAAIAITIAAIVHIWKSGLFRRRWLWTVGAIIGLTTLRLNWSNGEFSFQPISFLVFSASAVKQPVYAPWVLGVAIPLVALIALVRRKQRQVEGASRSS